MQHFGINRHHIAGGLIFAFFSMVLAACSNGGAQETFDIVILDGRVMDPETNFGARLL